MKIDKIFLKRLYEIEIDVDQQCEKAYKKDADSEDRFDEGYMRGLSRAKDAVEAIRNFYIASIEKKIYTCKD